MLDIKFLRQNVELVRRKMLERGQEMDFGPFLALDAKRRDIRQEVESLRSERNTVSHWLLSSVEPTWAMLGSSR